MSSESTPVLSHAISDFEMFMTEWENIRDQYEELRFWMEIGLDWAKKYYVRMDDTDAYVITMCKFHNNMSPLRLPLRPTVLNPGIRFSWIDIEWDDEYRRKAKDTILDLVSTSIASLHITNISRADAPVPSSGFIHACH